MSGNELQRIEVLAEVLSGRRTVASALTFRYFIDRYRVASRAEMNRWCNSEEGRSRDPRVVCDEVSAGGCWRAPGGWCGCSGSWPDEGTW